MFLVKKYIPRSIKFLLKNLLRKLNVFCMIITLHLCPGQTYRFSARKFFPSKKFRMKKNKLGNIPYKFMVGKNNSFEEIGEVNAVGKGNSFDLNKLKNIQKPTYLLSFWSPLLIDDNGEIAYSTKDNHKFMKNWSSSTPENERNIQKNKNYKEYFNSNITYVVSGYIEIVKKLSEAGHKVLVVNVFERKNSSNTNLQNKKYNNIFNHKNVKVISILDEIVKYPTEKPHPGFTQTGSVIPFLAAISFFSKKINVYGWDFFLKKSPANMSYLELISKMYSGKLDMLRSGTHFEEALINFYLGYNFSLNKKFNIYSYMGKLGSYKNLMNKIERVFFI